MDHQNACSDVGHASAQQDLECRKPTESVETGRYRYCLGGSERMIAASQRGDLVATIASAMIAMPAVTAK
jgi:hypothetical protein